jgi:hypothetical protein
MAGDRPSLLHLRSKARQRSHLGLGAEGLLALEGLLTRRRNAAKKPPEKAPQQDPQKESPQPPTKKA